MDRCVDAVLFEHDVALNGRGGLIFARLDDAIVAAVVLGTQHVEDDDGIADDLGAAIDRREQTTMPSG